MNLRRFVIKTVKAILLLIFTNPFFLASMPPPAPQTYGSIDSLIISIQSPHLYKGIPFAVRIFNPTDSPIYAPLNIYNKVDMVFHSLTTIAPHSSADVLPEIDTSGIYKISPPGINLKISAPPAFLISESLKYGVYYKFLRIGTQYFTAKRISDTIVVFKNRTISYIPFVKMDDEMTSYFYLPKMLPLKFTKKIREVGYFSDINIKFNHSDDSDSCTINYRLKKKKNAPWKKTVEIKKINKTCQDELSLVYFVRTFKNIRDMKQEGMLMFKPSEYHIKKIGEKGGDDILLLTPLNMKIWISRDRNRLINKIRYSTRLVPITAKLRK